MTSCPHPGARVIGAALVGVMVLGSAMGADAATKKKHHKPVKVIRTVKVAYNGGCTLETPAVVGSPTGECALVGAAGYVLTAKRGERFVSVTVTDATGRGVPGQFWEKGTGTVPNDTEVDFCGSLKNYQFPVGQDLQLDLDAIGGTTKCPGVATQGTVTLVFSNLP